MIRLDERMRGADSNRIVKFETRLTAVLGSDAALSLSASKEELVYISGGVALLPIAPDQDKSGFRSRRHHIGLGREITQTAEIKGESHTLSFQISP